MSNHEDELARNPSHSAMECVMRAVENFEGDEVDRVVVVGLAGDGYTVTLYSNAHSDPEMLGILQSAIDNNAIAYDIEDDDD